MDKKKIVTLETGKRELTIDIEGLGEKTFTRKHISGSYYRRWRGEIEKLQSQFESKEIDEVEYGCKMILLVSDGVTEEELMSIDVRLVGQLAPMLLELLQESTPESKKNALDTGIDTLPTAQGKGSLTQNLAH